MGESFNANIKEVMNKLFRLVWWFIVIQFVLLFVYFSWSHMMQLVFPISYRYTYKSVEASQTIYQTGEPIYWYSDVIRKRPISTQRQDTMYCDNWERTKKYPTQYRPPSWYEIPKLWTNDSVWRYEYDPDIDEIQCKLCGTVVAETEYGYNKNYQYCTNRFGVNWNKPDHTKVVAIYIK